MSTLPKSRIIVSYNDFFPDSELPDRLSLIRHISRLDLIGEISGLNYRLKPKDKKHTNYSLAVQDRELHYFCGGNKLLYEKYGGLARKFVNKGYPLLFTRQTCLYALEEIIQSDIPVIENFNMKNSWEPLLQYLLAVNGQLTKIRKEEREETTEDVETDTHPDADAAATVPSFEDINIQVIALNELNLGSDPLFLPYRAIQFLKFLTEHDQLGKVVVEYIMQGYGFDYRRFVFEITSLYIANNPNKHNNIKDTEIGFELDTTFIYYPKAETLKLFRELSKCYPSNDPEKLLSIRKYPFFNDNDQQFYLTDNTILLEKIYYQFINDFWFEKVKTILDEDSKPKFNIRYYRSVIGNFFEKYVSECFKFMVKNGKHLKLRQFQELNILESGNQVEFTDVYLRYNNRIFLGEAKATSIYDKEKYSGDLNEFYRDGREAFFDAFGVNQIVKAVSKLKSLAFQFDPGFPRKGTVQVFPAVIVNEKALQTPLMAQVFNKRFQELIAEMNIDLSQIRLAPLAIIHISDLENIEEKVHKETGIFWRIMKRHADNPLFIPPFYHTVNTLKIVPAYEKPIKIIRELIDEYNPKLSSQG